MSIFDQQSNHSAHCFGVCFSSEEPNYDFLKQQQQQQHNSRSRLTNEDEQKKKEVDDLLSDAMNQLSFEERQHQQEVLHGVDDQIVEEATFINSALQELDNHLMMRIKNFRPSSAYKTAERLDPTYVRATAFRVMFLRSNQYDIRAAAGQMIQFFEVKQKLFGVEKLVKDITMEDLDEDDRASLSTGWLQLHGHDRSNRAICFQLPGHRAFKNLRNELRGKFYFLMSLLKNEETQLRGVVHVIYTVDEFKDSRPGVGYVENVQVTLSVPVHSAAVHFCSSDVKEYAPCYLAVKAMPAGLRSRLKVHFGSHLECQYHLSTYGISKKPLSNLDHCKQWFPQDNQLDTNAEIQSSSLIAQPSPNDVLYTGSGKSNNLGNQQLRALVLKYFQAYDSGTNETKGIVVNGIIHEIEKSGGRFLKHPNNEVQSVWVPVPVDDLRIKVAQMFRNRRRRR